MMNFLTFLSALILLVLIINNIINNVNGQINEGSITFRSDFVDIITSKTEDYSGVWSEWEYCDENAYGVGFNLKIEDNTGKGDDTSVNSFALVCKNNTNGGSNEVNRLMRRRHNRLLLLSQNIDDDTTDTRQKREKTSDEDDSVINSMKLGNIDGKKGKWKKFQICNNGNEYLRGFKTKVEKYIVNNDNTALNSVTGYCTNTHDEISINHNGLGKWAEKPSMCPKHSIVCGFRQKLPSFRESNTDNWGLSEIELACCQAPIKFVESEGYWVRRIRGINRDSSLSYDSDVGIINYGASWSYKNSKSLIMSLSNRIGMLFSYFDNNNNVNEEKRALLSYPAVNKIIEQSIEDVLRKIDSKYKMSCHSGKALFQYVNSISFESYNLDENKFDILTYDYICSQSGQAPKCPYQYCKDLSENSNDPDCQICKENLFLD